MHIFFLENVQIFYISQVPIEHCTSDQIAGAVGFLQTLPPAFLPVPPIWAVSLKDGVHELIEN